MRRRAIASLHGYIAHTSEELRVTETLLRDAALNHRQQALITHALRHPGMRYSIQGHRRSHGIVYETARRDLLQLAALKLLETRHRGKAFSFTVPQDLPDRLRNRKS